MDKYTFHTPDALTNVINRVVDAACPCCKKPVSVVLYDKKLVAVTEYERPFAQTIKVECSNCPSTALVDLHRHTSLDKAFNKLQGRQLVPVTQQFLGVDPELKRRRSSILFDRDFFRYEPYVLEWFYHPQSNSLIQRSHQFACATCNGSVLLNIYDIKISRYRWGWWFNKIERLEVQDKKVFVEAFCLKESKRICGRMVSFSLCSSLPNVVLHKYCKLIEKKDGQANA